MREKQQRIGFVQTAVISGVAAHPVTVEVNVAQGLPGISIVGMPDTAVSESKLRVRQALRSCDFEIPNMHIIVNLAPSSMPKSGSGFDLPIAAGILTATGQIPTELLDGRLCVGELSLDGSVRPIKGMLAYERLAAEMRIGLLSAVVGRGAQYEQAGSHLCIDSLQDLRQASFCDPIATESDFCEHTIDYCDIADNDLAKRALQIAAAGEHCLLMVGPPGSGKSMLAARLPTILAPLDINQRRESAMIHSVAGLPYDSILQGHRPFRAPHHSATRAGLLGGGSPPAPGEVSLAHNGVLFLDEMPEFGSAVLQMLRQPIENGTVSLARARGTTVFPAAFLLIAAANPCPCGYFGDPERHCRCSPAEIARYQGRIGGPLIDRFDMVIDVWRSQPGDVLATGTGLSSAKMLATVMQAQEFRQKREQNAPVTGSISGIDRFSTELLNGIHHADSGPAKRDSFLSTSSSGTCASTSDSSDAASPSGVGHGASIAFKGEGYRLLETCRLSARERDCLKEAARHFELSGRGIMKALAVARTIADLEQSEAVCCEHLLEAVTFRAESRARNDIHR
ncbi:MAG: YifB family Mg chelatase-like AAA ATPase [Coriobacteriales bacterium]|jgi:magnesium chelatase family protein|nr:YifB family Mg chelatase-like AAA ATPase [Coriobacteriales bacterium]